MANTTPERKNGNGALFPNERKKSDSHPDMTGTLVGLDGEEYWISAWNKTDRNTKPFVSIAIQKKQPKA